MKKNSPPMFRYLSKLTCILIIVLFQLPAFALALDFKNLNHSNTIPLSKISESNAAARNRLPMMTVFSNTTAITITDRDNNVNPTGSVGISNPYPSTIAVSGLSGTVSDVNVTLTGYSSLRPRDNDFVLVGPNGQALTLMADTGGGATFPVSNVNLTFDDSAAAQPAETTQLTSGTYKPVDYVFSATDRDDFPSPGPSSVNDPAPTGSSTLASVFNGINPNGDWSLFAIDDSQGNGNSTVSGGWSIDITTAAGVEATNTTVSSNTNPALTTQTITFTSTTTQVNNSSLVTSGTVSFTQNNTAIAGCTNVPVNASGNAACMTTFSEGTRTITATYSGTASFGQSSGGLSQVVNSPTVVMGSQFCNNGGITIPDAATASQYPSNITVSGLVGTISNVQVLLNNFSAFKPRDMDLLLVGANNQAFEIMSDSGDNAVAVTNLNLTLDDNAASPLADGNTVLTGGTFKPSDYEPSNTDGYPAPAPGSFASPAPTGTATFASAYGNSNPNGTWRLFVVDDGPSGSNAPNTTITSWCVNFTLTPFSTMTTLGSAPNPSVPGQNVTFTATVSSSGGTPTGSVQFFDGMTSLGTQTLNGSGQATLMTSTLTPGTHNITAQYLGTSGAGGGGFNGSTSGIVIQTVIDNTPPDTMIIANPTNPSGANVSFSFAGDDFGGSGVASFECDLDNGGFAACVSPKAYTNLSSGSHTFRVRAIDNQNNVDATPASYMWTVDASAPDTTIDSSPANPSNSGSASFTFSSNETGSTFECKLDMGAFAACTSPQNYSSLADGSHTFTVRAIDNLGNVDQTPASYMWTVDTTAPNTTIDSNPPNPSNSSSAGFTFSGTDTGGTGVASFECKLDMGAFAACTSGQNYTGLSDGSHTFMVRAIDNAGNRDATPASYTWTIDTTAPNTTINGNPSNPSNSSSATFNFSGTDVGGTGVASFECKLDMSAFAACTSPQNYSGLSDGSHTFQVRAIDGAGNADATPASFTWTIDTAAPAVTINQASSQTDPAGGSPINFTAVFNESVTGFTSTDVILGGTAGATTVVVTEIAPMNGTTYNVAVSEMTTGGTVTVSIPANRANDAAGNGNTASTSTDNTVTFVPNSPPTANPDNYMTNEDTPLSVVAPGVLGNDSDPNTGDTITAVLVSGPSNAASFTLNADGSFSYTPNANFNGGDSFSYKARDNSNADSSPVMVSITVNPVNDPPDAVNDSATVSEDSGANIINVRSNDQIAPDTGETLIVTAVTQGASGAVAITNGGANVSYTPNANFFGTDLFTYTVSDGNGGSDTAAVNVTVTPANDQPTGMIVGGGSCGASSTSGTVNLLVGDADTPAGSLTLTGSSSNTAVVPNANIVFGGSGANRTVTITAVPQNNVQSSTVTVTISDGQGGTSMVTIRVIVGTNKKEIINGTSSTDMIFGGNGDDTVNAGAGNDLVCGGNGNGTVNGGQGDDTLDGGNGDDTLRGEDGNDVLSGGNGNDRLEGGNNDDALTGGSGADFFSGGTGTDTTTDFSPGLGDTTDGSIP